MLVYSNLEELRGTDEELANEITEVFGEGDWEKEEITVWSDTTEFAEFEVEEGFYANYIENSDFNGAPNLYDYIDYEALGEALPYNWDDSMYFLSNSGEVVEISL